MEVLLDGFKWQEEMKTAVDIVKRFLGDRDIVVTCANSKAVQRHGRCSWKVGQEKEFTIAISTSLVKKEDVINTCIHELLHAYYPQDGHTGNWAWAANVISNRTEYNIQRCDDKEHDVKYKYDIVCSCCGKVIDHRMRKCKVTTNPEGYKSICCGAEIKVIQNF